MILNLIFCTVLCRKECSIKISGIDGNKVWFLWKVNNSTKVKMPRFSERRGVESGKL